MPDVCENQDEVIGFLSDPDTYGLKPGVIARRETHGAIVFLAGDKAYKLKRAVKFPYMDYCTVERRREKCERELSVNRRTAPQIYLDAKPIVRGPDGRPRFGTANDRQVLDWVVVMKRFDEQALLGVMRETGRLTPELLRKLAETIARFHRSAEPRRDYGGASGMTEIVSKNIEMIRSFAHRPFDPDVIDRLAEASAAACETLGPLLDGRLSRGYVRRCHGDMHLNNIVVIDGKPVLFDAVEFNESFACIDVAYDLSFVLMDLDRHGDRAFANILLNRYLEITGDYESLKALPLFLSCRAAIRAHVCAATGGLATGQSHKFDEAQTLLSQALAYLQPPPAQLVAIGGLSGTGKSTVARAVAPLLGPAPGAVIVRTDIVRKQLFGVSETTRLPADAYTLEANSRVYDEMAKRVAAVAAAGHAVIADAVFGAANERRVMAGIAARHSLPFQGLWLGADPKILAARIGSRKGDASDATVDILNQQLLKISAPEDWPSVDASGQPDDVLDAAKQLVMPAPQLPS